MPQVHKPEPLPGIEKETRAQPWKQFFNDKSPDFAKIRAAAPSQRYFDMSTPGSNPILQYAAENGG